jgi:hypothetical protein
MVNLDSSVGTVKGRTTDGCGSILAGFKTFSRFVNVHTVSGAYRILYYIQWLFVVFKWAIHVVLDTVTNDR